MKKVLSGLHNGDPITATVTTERGYFSVTGAMHKTGGAIHKEILGAFPQLAPLVDLHLSDLEGVPMHAEANGYYWLAGALGGLQQRFHGSNDGRHTPEQCIQILADYVRVSLPIAQGIVTAFEAYRQAVGEKGCRPLWNTWVAEQKLRWYAEAQAGIALLNSLG